MQIHNLDIQKKERSVVEIKGEISTDDFELARPKAIEKLAEHIEIDGFRKGKAPMNMVEQKLGEQIILEEMAQITLSKAYPTILVDNKIEAIGYPRISITKLAKGNPLGFTIETAVVPEVALPDYKAIAKEANKSVEPATVSDEEFESFMLRIKKAKAHEDYHKANPDVKDHNHPEIKDEDLPELTEEYVKTLGDFASLEDFSKKMREDLQKDKERRHKEKQRLAIIEAIEAKTVIDVPDILIQSETEKMISRMKSDVEQMGLSYEDYLKSLNKSDDDIRADFAADAKKRAKVQMIVSEIAAKEKLSADKETLDTEVKKVMEAYKDADEANARMYIENVLSNEEVFKFLEGQK